MEPEDRLIVLWTSFYINSELLRFRIFGSGVAPPCSSSIMIRDDDCIYRLEANKKLVDRPEQAGISIIISEY